MTSSVPTQTGGVDAPDSSNATMDLSTSRQAKKQHDQIVSWTNSMFKGIRNARISTERQWYLNLAFFFGKQNVSVMRAQTNGLGTGAATRLYVPPAPYYRVRPVINRIRPTIRHELSQLTNNKPSASITPSSSEDKDLFAAQAGEQVWENLYLDNKLKFVFRRSVWWSLVCGTGFIKTWWDPTCGPTADETGQPEGAIKYCAETPFHVLCPDLREEEIEEQPFVIHAQQKSVEWVKMHWKTALDGSPIDPNQGQSQEILEDSYLNLTGTQTLNKQHQVLVLEVWVKPGGHPLFPNGAMYTIVGDKIVQGQENLPYSHGKYPFAKIDHIPGGKFYATSSVEDLIPLQKEYNRTRGQIIEAKNRMAKPQLLAARGSVDPSKMTTEPGQVIEYTPGFDKPTPLPLVALPSYVIQELDRLLVDWNDISGQHDVSKGQAPPGVTAATAISYLQERDESKLSPTFDSLEEAIEKVARCSLVYVHDYWTTERMVKVTGPDGSFDVMAFKGSDLGDNLDIRVEGGSSLPTSKAAKQALITDWMKLGFITPEKGMEVMDVGGMNKIYEEIQIDRKQAQRENLRMSQVDDTTMQQWDAQSQQSAMQAMMTGTQPPPTPLIVPVNTWDNHKVHVESHNNYRKSQSFDNLPHVAKQLFEQHVNQHIQAMGIEAYTMNPSIASGLPPLPQPGQDPGASAGGGQPSPIDMQMSKGNPQQDIGQQLGQQLNNGQPGPMPMPQTSGGQ